ncbi:MAG TPA: hypothetical protein VJ550_02405 [Geomonas sp.]|nr:hypothetical protein [Geomonas sp.]
MLSRILSVLCMAIVLGGCATYRETTPRLDEYSQHYSQFDLQLAWNTRVADGVTIIDGIVKNVRYQAVYDLEIWVSVLAPRQKVTARAVSYVIPSQLNLEDTARFSLELPQAVQPGSRLQFTYRYRATEGGGDNGGTNWMQSFDVLVPQR